jgi:hypothetical protein
MGSIKKKSNVSDLSFYKLKKSLQEDGFDIVETTEEKDIKLQVIIEKKKDQSKDSEFNP